MISYVVLPPDVIGEVMNGHRTTLPVIHCAEVGSTIGLKTDPDKPPSCLMDVTACDPDPDGYTIRLRPHVYEETPRLLRAGSPLTGGGKARLMSNRKRTFKDIRAKAPNGDKFTDDQALGYTENPSMALLDAGEAVDLQTQAQFARQALQRDQQRKIKRDAAAKRDRELLSIEERMLQARATARLNSISVHQEMKALTHMQRRGRSEGLVVQELERVERIAYREAA